MYKCCAAQHELSWQYGEAGAGENERNCCMENYVYQSQFYPEYYEVMQMLIELGCKPENDDWRL